MGRSPELLARRYVAWLRRRALAVIAAHLVLLGGAVYLIKYHLPLFADFSYLLPQDAPAVRDLRKLEARVKTTDTVLVVIDAPTPESRVAAETEMLAGLREISSDLVLRVDADDAAIRAWERAHRYLYVKVEDLVRARDALRHRIDSAKLKANPLYVDLDDEKDKASEAADNQELKDLQDQRRAAEAKLDHPSNITADGLREMLQVRTGFRSTDAARGESLLGALDRVRARVIAAHPGVTMGFTGGVVTALSEHNAITRGIVLSSLVTTVLVGLVLALYFRSATMLAMLVGTIGIATTAAFGAAAFTVGHLNAATAFLGAIIAGNGINYGILLIARYLEERRKRSIDDALAAAIVGTLRPTAVASLGAAIAYGSLAATSFKGFADFAVIGAIGMLLCWVATYVLLPALMLRFGRDSRTYSGDPVVGTLLVRAIGFRRSHLVVAISALVGVAAFAVVIKYVAADPFEYNIRHLRSEGEDAAEARRWMSLSDKSFGRGYAGRTFIAADRLDQVPLIVRALEGRNAGKPPKLQTIGSIESILTAIPPDQDKRLAVLGEIRAMLDDDALSVLDDKERAELLALRPPDDLAAVTLESLPPGLKEPLTEKDGRLGYLIQIRPAITLDEWNGHDLIRFANAVRELKLDDGESVTTSGTSVIFADIVDSIERDGPVVTTIAAGGLLVMVVLLVGRNRRSAAVLAATTGGTLLMVATCALLGLKVNFLDFVALPITLGLGIDYAINVAHRHDHEEVPDPITTLRTSGSAVFVCSLTTMIGYGSLLVSDNLAIRGFGTASLIGEVTCVLSALILVPALLAIRGRSRAPSTTDTAAA
ncbi:MAG: putative rane protein [Myxococcales bacterium]|nr:putative rane protein [Myxococcales bacterium]